VLELADETGVYCGKLLADMGADVIKIERPGGDGTREIPPFWRDQPHPERSLFFLYMNTSKRGVTLDIARPEGQALFKRLTRKPINPGLVLASISGFGQTGPYRDFKSSDIVASAMGGAMYVTGEEEDPPVRLAGSQAHVMASLFAAVSSMIALHHSSVSGEGQHVDISVEEATASVSHISGVGKWLDDGIIPRRCGTGLFASVPSGSYRCKDGLVYLMINRALHWKALAQWVHEITGNREILDPMFEGPSSNRQPYRDLLDVYLSDFTSQFTVDEIYREGQRRHLALTPVNTAAAVARDAHLAAREYFVEVDHPGTGRLRYPGAPYRHSETPWTIARPAPRVGQHNREIYGGELGVSGETLRAFEEGGVI
jgi:crotonobetainyl-CoA:carnitine CoA-transferase CaiB-like acyl-CoA transferase